MNLCYYYFILIKVVLFYIVNTMEYILVVTKANIFFIRLSKAVKPAHAVTCIKRSPFI